MAQNIYDNQEFFDGYSRLFRSVHGLDGAPEWPVLRAMLPDLRGRRVLDLGCGFGWFCRWARLSGAASVIGIDLSDNMLARARSAPRDAAITYTKGDMENLKLPAASFELVYSSLALHYVESLERLMSQVHQALVPGGSLVFCVEHPLYTAPADPAWTTDASGRKIWPVNCYLDEGPRSTNWLVHGVIKQHRTIATYINTLASLGFRVSRIEEWGPSEEQVADRPILADDHQRPPFLMISATS